MVLQIIEKLLSRKTAETVNDIIKCYDGNKRIRKTIDRMWSVFFSYQYIRYARGRQQRWRGIAPTFLDFSPCAHNEQRVAARGIGGSREY